MSSRVCFQDGAEENQRHQRHAEPRALVLRPDRWPTRFDGPERVCRPQPLPWRRTALRDPRYQMRSLTFEDSAASCSPAPTPGLRTAADDGLRSFDWAGDVAPTSLTGPKSVAETGWIFFSFLLFVCFFFFIGLTSRGRFSVSTIELHRPTAFIAPTVGPQTRPRWDRSDAKRRLSLDNHYVHPPGQFLLFVCFFLFSSGGWSSASY